MHHHHEDDSRDEWLWLDKYALLIWAACVALLTIACFRG